MNKHNILLMMAPGYWIKTRNTPERPNKKKALQVSIRAHKHTFRQNKQVILVKQSQFLWVIIKYSGGKSLKRDKTTHIGHIKLPSAFSDTRTRFHQVTSPAAHFMHQCDISFVSEKLLLIAVSQHSNVSSRLLKGTLSFLLRSLGTSTAKSNQNQCFHFPLQMLDLASRKILTLT